MKYKVATKTIDSQNLFVINSYIEVIESNSSKFPICKDLVFLEFYKGFDRKTQISMQYNSFELRRLSYALKELYKLGHSSYKNFTDPSLSSNSNNSGKKSVSVGKSGDSFFLNLSQSNEATRNVQLDKYSLLSLCDSLNLISEETERTLYKYQRQLEQKTKQALSQNV